MGRLSLRLTYHTLVYVVWSQATDVRNRVCRSFPVSRSSREGTQLAQCDAPQHSENTRGNGDREDILVKIVTRTTSEHLGRMHKETNWRNYVQRSIFGDQSEKAQNLGGRR
jgi:hypothetical protein